MAYANILFPFIFNVHISQKSPIMKIPARCQFCLLTQFKACFSCGDKLGLWNTSMPHPFLTTTREKKLFNEPLYIVTIKRFLEISFTSGDQSIQWPFQWFSLIRTCPSSVQLLETILVKRNFTINMETNSKTYLSSAFHLPFSWVWTAKIPYLNSGRSTHSHCLVWLARLQMEKNRKIKARE